MIVDFDYYKNVFCGNAIKQEDFDQFSRKAERFVAYATVNKAILTSGEVLNSVKDCICELAECYASFDKMEKQALGEGEKVISSESVGTWSASYDTSAQRTGTDIATDVTQRNKKLYSIVKEYLASTGLLYKGVN